MTDKEWQAFHEASRPSLFESAAFCNWFFGKIYGIQYDRFQEESARHHRKEQDLAAAKRAFESIINGFAK